VIVKKFYFRKPCITAVSCDSVQNTDVICQRAAATCQCLLIFFYPHLGISSPTPAASTTWLVWICASSWFREDVMRCDSTTQVLFHSLPFGVGDFALVWNRYWKWTVSGQQAAQSECTLHSVVTEIGLRAWVEDVRCKSTTILLLLAYNILLFDFSDFLQYTSY